MGVSRLDASWIATIKQVVALEIEKSENTGIMKIEENNERPMPRLVVTINPKITTAKAARDLINSKIMRHPDLEATVQDEIDGESIKKTGLIEDELIINERPPLLDRITQIGRTPQTERK